MSDVRVILVSATDKILEQIDEELGKFALEKLKEGGVEFIMNTEVKGQQKIKQYCKMTLMILVLFPDLDCWTLNKLIANLQCEHDKGHRITANDYLQVPA